MFTHIKYTARGLIKKRTAVGFLLLTARLLPFAAGAVSVCALAGCALFRAQNVTGFAFLENVWLKAAFYAFLVFAAVFFTLTFSAVSFASQAYFMHFAANGCRMRIFFTLRQSVRYLRCMLLKCAFALLWAALFFSPCAALAGISVLLLKSEGLYIPVLIALCVCVLLLFAVGCVFFLLSLTRYFMCTYLLCCNPKMPVRDALEESVFLMRNRERKTLLFLFSFLPQLLLGVIPVFLPSVYAYIKTACVRLAAEYFGENVSESKKGCAVVYYINDKTRFSVPQTENGNNGSGAV